MKSRPVRAGALLSALLATSSPAAQPPVLEFLFDEDSGTTAINSGTLGAGSNGVLSGATRSVETPFQTGFALSLDGDTDFVEIADTFDYGSTLTVEAWIRPDAVDGQRAVYDDYGNPGVFLAIYDGTLQFNISTGTHSGIGIAVFDGTLCPGLWQHVAGTYDGTALRAYVNGIEVGTVATSGDIYDNGGYPTHIGADSSAPSFLEFVGRMDDLRVFAEALAPEELGDGVSLLLCGELTGDCAITASDALAALRMAVSLEDPAPAADMNGSGSISATDALQLLRIGVGLQEHTGTCNA